MTRKSFLQGGLSALGAMIFPGTRCFAAPVGWKPKGKPELVFGFITDSHIRRDGDPLKERVWPRTPTTNLENAFSLFRDRNVDAVVHAGDMAHRGLRCELQFHADVWFTFFPNDRLPNGKKVERIFVTGNHEWFRNDPFAERVYPNPEKRREAILANDIARHWSEVWHEPYERVWHKTVKGFHFFGEHFEDRFGDVEHLIRSEKDALNRKKPFFLLHHMMPDRTFCEHLQDFPNAMMLFGHWHNSAAHLGTIHHDEFVLLNGPSLRGNDIPEIPGYTPDPTTRCKHDDIQQAYLIRVFKEMVVFERHDIKHGGKIGPDLVFPLGENHRKAFSREELMATTGAPAFGSHSRLHVSRGQDAMEVQIPVADANPNARVYLYDIHLTNDHEKPTLLKKCIFASGCDFAMNHRAAKAWTKIVIPLAEIPSGKRIRVSVYPVSSLGIAGNPIRTEMDT